MKFLTLFTTVAFASEAAETKAAGTIADDQPCGLEATKVDSKGGCKSEKAKCDAVPKAKAAKAAAGAEAEPSKEEPAAGVRRMLAEDAKATKGTCTAAQAICRAHTTEVAADFTTAMTKCTADKTANCKWVKASPAVENKGTCEAECKCTVSGTTVVSATVAFVTAIFLL